MKVKLAELLGKDPFLSCLFGSEAYLASVVPQVDFLSCLFGSEAFVNLVLRCSDFLSCLFGSEEKRLQRGRHGKISELPIRQ